MFGVAVYSTMRGLSEMPRGASQARGVSGLGSSSVRIPGAGDVANTLMSTKCAPAMWAVSYATFGPRCRTTRFLLFRCSFSHCGLTTSFSRGPWATSGAANASATRALLSMVIRRYEPTHQPTNPLTHQPANPLTHSYSISHLPDGH